jgi:hypothetical protein
MGGTPMLPRKIHRMIAVRLHNRRRVAVVATTRLPVSAATAWGQMRSFSDFVGLDPFHSDVRTPDGRSPSRLGDAIILGHRFGPIRFDRVGRILKWREGRGYSFSDLARGDPRRGFPHVFTYDLHPRGPRSCRFILTLRGHWTYPRLPSWLIRRWLRRVLSHTLHAVRNRMLLIALHHAQAGLNS